MKIIRQISYLAALLIAGALLSCNKVNPDPQPGPAPVESDGDGNLAYQILVYSFCDSNGDGIGDFNGIASKLDYLHDMGVTALWLSPVHPASSYHGYDVIDYEALNSEYGSESDFKNLLSKAKAKGISIYLDFVLNHSSRDCQWFKEALKGPDSPYFEYYSLSLDPQKDIAEGRIPMISREGSNGYVASQWFTASSTSAGKQRVKFTLDWDSKTLLAEQVSEIVNEGEQNSGKYLYYGNAEMAEFYSTGSSVYTLSLDFESSWGLLVRSSSTSWDAGTKWGASSSAGAMAWGKPFSLNSTDAKDILPPGTVAYKYHSHFETASFADLNYGPASTCEQSPAFQAVAAAADKWINMGVDGLRLDAVKHIYHSATSDENPTFLKKYYDHCNATYKARGGEGEFFMVCEAWDSYTVTAKYYAGTPSCFNFNFWDLLSNRINNGKGNDFAAECVKVRQENAKYRKDFIDAPKLSNHDQDRTGEVLGKDLAKMKLAGAVLLTSPGKPFIYQGEELGYWGNKGGGDQYVRSPMLWSNDKQGFADKKLGSRIDNGMLSGSIAVDEQLKDDDSILNVYKRFGKARSSYPALAKGDMKEVSVGVPEMAVWTMTYEGQTVLVVHNFGKETRKVNLEGYKLGKCVVSNGQVALDGTRVQLSSCGSAVYLQ